MTGDAISVVICVSAAGVYRKSIYSDVIEMNHRLIVIVYSCNEDENMWNVNLDQALAVLFMGQRHAPIAHC